MVKTTCSFMRACVDCKTSISVSNYGRKLCSSCKIKRNKNNKNIWYLKNYKKQNSLLFCTKCFNELPPHSNKDRKYCDKCLKVRQSIMKKIWYKERV